MVCRWGSDLGQRMGQRGVGGSGGGIGIIVSNGAAIKMGGRCQMLAGGVVTQSGLPALGISNAGNRAGAVVSDGQALPGRMCKAGKLIPAVTADDLIAIDRKSTRLNSSHLGISYAV